jgi:hypothetical protein
MDHWEELIDKEGKVHKSLEKSLAKSSSRLIGLFHLPSYLFEFFEAEVQ